MKIYQEFLMGQEDLVEKEINVADGIFVQQIPYEVAVFCLFTIMLL